MKYDTSRTPTRGAKRVLSAFSEALFSLLSEKSFETITVGELAERSGYPRATFYNYFDDKYDLLNFYWYAISIGVKFEEFGQYAPEKLLDVYFDRLYELLLAFEKEIRSILRHNTWDGYFISSCKIYLTERIRTVLSTPEIACHIPVPAELLAEHYANTLLLVFGKRFDTSGVPLSKETTRAYLDYLLYGTRSAGFMKNT